MSETITKADYISALSEVIAHRDLEDHRNCDFCKWVHKMVLEDKDFVEQMLSDRVAPVDPFEALMFLYMGVKLGRRQATTELSRIKR